MRALRPSDEVIAADSFVSLCVRFSFKLPPLARAAVPETAQNWPEAQGIPQLVL
jgi:hypothetical protein